MCFLRGEGAARPRAVAPPLAPVLAPRGMSLEARVVWVHVTLNPGHKGLRSQLQLTQATTMCQARQSRAVEAFAGCHRPYWGSPGLASLRDGANRFLCTQESHKSKSQGCPNSWRGCPACMWGWRTAEQIHPQNNVYGDPKTVG